jgi:hypothetical protein
MHNISIASRSHPSEITIFKYLETIYTFTSDDGGWGCKIFFFLHSHIHFVCSVQYYVGTRNIKINYQKFIYFPCVWECRRELIFHRRYGTFINRRTHISIFSVAYIKLLWEFLEQHLSIYGNSFYVFSL